MKLRIIITALALLLSSQAIAQEMPSDYQQVLKIVGKSGDYKANVLKVNIPRNDIHVTIDSLAAREGRLGC
jgi:hypothetical protein